MKLLFVFSIILFITIIGIHQSFGHGVGSEIFPPVDLNGKQVSLEVSSSPSNQNTINPQQITISLIDFNSKITLRDVTF
ncbi:MAG TPA: peptidase, partial [Nitrosarchaeum sp.]|nr:peptidase [Nitrosarchaeum sp.]